MKYTELHVHTEFTRGNGLTEIPALVSRARELGMHTLALTDSGTLAGVPLFSRECEKQGIKPIYGCGFYFAPLGIDKEDTHHLVLLAQNARGFENLKFLNQWAFAQKSGNKPRIDYSVLMQHCEGLICLTGGLGGVVDKPWLSGNRELALDNIKKLKDIFADKFYLELQDNGLENNKIMRAVHMDLSEKLNIQSVVTGGSFYLHAGDADSCNRLRREHGNKTLKGSEYYFKSEEEIRRNFKELQASVDRSSLIASSCEVFKLTGSDDLQ